MAEASGFFQVKTKIKMELSQKTAFITGGSSGIGLAIAKALAAKNCHVVIIARDIEKLEAAIQKIEAHKTADQQKITYYSCDTSDYPQVKNIFENAIWENGEPDILVNCAGIAQPNYFENITFEAFEKTIRTNLYSTWNVCSVCLPAMKAKGGHIINTSSLAGFLGVFGYTDYNMTKFGIIGFSEALKQEVAQYNIKVSVLCPPDTDTPGFAEENKTKPAETLAISGNAKVVSADFIAKHVVNAIGKNTFLILPGFDSKLTYFLKRYSPWLVEWIMNMSIRKAQKQKNAK
jgi:short-subunit dehydrogenase